MKLKIVLALVIALGALSCGTSQTKTGGDTSRRTGSCDIPGQRSELENIMGRGDEIDMQRVANSEGRLRAIATDANDGVLNMSRPGDVIGCRAISMRANMLLSLLPPEHGADAATSHPNLRAAGEQARLGAQVCEGLTDPEGANAADCAVLRFYQDAVPAKQALQEIETATPEDRTANAPNEVWTTTGASLRQLTTFTAHPVSGALETAEMHNTACGLWRVATPLLAQPAEGDEGRTLKRERFTHPYYRAMAAASMGLGHATESSACAANAGAIECAEDRARTMENACANPG
jgi:hypothetical protein